MIFRIKFMKKKTPTEAPSTQAEAQCNLYESTASLKESLTDRMHARRDFLLTKIAEIEEALRVLEYAPGAEKIAKVIERTGCL